MYDIYPPFPLVGYRLKFTPPRIFFTDNPLSSSLFCDNDPREDIFKNWIPVICVEQKKKEFERKIAHRNDTLFGVW